MTVNSPKAEQHISRTAHIRQLAKLDRGAAIKELGAFLADTFDIEVHNVRINYDQYSLNSLNGFFDSEEKSYFFKFHQEEGEEDMKGEYYRADLLAKANLPVDMPVWKSSLPGEQILVYNRRLDSRFSDVLKELDEHPDAARAELAEKAERKLNGHILKVARDTLHPVRADQVADEPFHHLFYERMIDLKTGEAPGGRYLNFYVDKMFEFEECSLSWAQFSTAQLVLNGQEMALNFAEIFAHAVHHLNPQNLTEAGGFTAHGDAHNANVWFIEEARNAQLAYFDPAFAGEHIPSLMAEIKATFHNIFAHPFWLYDPDLAADTWDVEVEYSKNTLSINTNWALSAVREKLLAAKIQSFWRPFLAHLSTQNMLPDNWQDVMRSAFAMCPTLVMNLRAGADRHNPASSAIGFFVAALAGSRPKRGENIFTRFFAQIDPG